MITRLRKIVQVGVFRKPTELGKYQLKKFTVFYALNTYGKTTLKDIFLSITNDDPNLIEKRKSIPHENIQQDILLSFNKNGVEQSLCFSENWKPKDLKGKIVVFDNDFIHRNLITGFSITRENKESLTDFILGEEGVNLSEEIRLLNRNLQEKKNNLKKPTFIKDSKKQSEIDEFLNLNVVESETSLQSLITELNRNIENLSSITEITNLPEIELPVVTIEKTLNELIEELNLVLAKDYKDVTEEVKETLLSHIRQCTQGEGAKSWIKQGLKDHMKDYCCPFCGQNLLNSHELIEAYNNFFNEKYETYSTSISNSLDNIEGRLNKITLKTKTEFLTLLTSLNKYKKYDPNINSDLVYDNLSPLEIDVKEKLDAQKEIIKKIIYKKIKSHTNHFPLSQLDFGHFIELAVPFNVINRLI